MKHGLYEIYWTSGGSSLAAIGYDQQGYNWIAPCNWTSGSTTDWGGWGSIKAIKLIIANDYTKRTKSVKSEYPKQEFNSDNFNIEYDENS